MPRLSDSFGAFLSCASKEEDADGSLAANVRSGFTRTNMWIDLKRLKGPSTGERGGELHTVDLVAVCKRPKRL